MTTKQVADYSIEVEILKRYLEPEHPSMGMDFGWYQPKPDETIYLGEVDAHCCDYIPAEKLTTDPELKLRLCEIAKAEGILDEEQYIDADWDNLSVDVFYPLMKMEPVDRALHRLRTLLANSYGVLSGNGHDWSCVVGRQLAYWYSGDTNTQYGEWKWNGDPDHEDGSPTLDFIQKHKFDLSSWVRFYDEDLDEGLDDTSSYSWVEEHHIAELLFGLTEKDLSVWYGKHITHAIAFILDGLRETQPEHWSRDMQQSLYIADATTLDLPTFEACRDRYADRVSTHSAFTSIASHMRATTNLDGMNAVIRQMYEVAKQQNVWIID